MSGVLAFVRPGVWELVIILVIVLLIFGAKKLPQIGSAIGETIKGFRKSMGEDKGDPKDKKEDHDS